MWFISTFVPDSATYWEILSVYMIISVLNITYFFGTIFSYFFRTIIFIFSYFLNYAYLYARASAHTKSNRDIIIETLQSCY